LIINKVAVDMELESKLMAAIMGAISAYIEMEKHPFSPACEARPESEVGGARFPDDTGAVKAQKA